MTLFDEPPTDEERLCEEVADLIGRYGFKPVHYEVERHTPLTLAHSAPARSTDPETSHMAAKTEHDVGRFGPKSRQARLLAVFSGGDFTDQQAAIRVVGTSAVPSAFDGCRRRCSDLRAAGLLCDSGIRRRNPGSTDESVVWRITLAGERALRNLDEKGWSK